ncbi:hypothetical protein MTR_2g025250 [Medicago truncatula]|uniref:Uncharacterized protein n=1 Tax=Medicago truncatula TaxID=3880 RepID=G7ILS0_MEDTR|nr:hypothetical protein MTR_2g025250 [Medicago truncatula]
MENESSDPFEGSEPTITLLGKPVSDRKDVRIRSVDKRTIKTPKTRHKSMQTDVKTVFLSIKDNQGSLYHLSSSAISSAY